MDVIVIARMSTGMTRMARSDIIEVDNLAIVWWIWLSDSLVWEATSRK